MKTWIYIDGTFKDAHAEIELLRGYRDAAEADAAAARLLADKSRLTDEEREAIEWAAGACGIEQTTASDAADRGYKLPDTREWAAKHGRRAATLRGLLEKHKGGER